MDDTVGCVPFWLAGRAHIEGERLPVPSGPYLRQGYCLAHAVPRGPHVHAAFIQVIQREQRRLPKILVAHARKDAAASVRSYQKLEIKVLLAGVLRLRTRAFADSGIKSAIIQHSSAGACMSFLATPAVYPNWVISSQ